MNLFQYLLLQKKKLEEERNALRKEVVALRIMQANYEQMVKAQQIPIGHVETRIPDEEKFLMVIIFVVKDNYCIIIIFFFSHFIFLKLIFVYIHLKIIIFFNQLGK